ncbi:MAG: asparagine synthase (glutamine-hydrolyzing) [Candidatus Sungbacteria bacterium RIFCSPHIGHO2_01_FULL_54_26]|nr:MAG: asparagine synthase (glutamine-hydrolyzing) [Candidatus Sungbacteria bacterium RIFCSPHIGHO2_01_FULL_54_26]
MCGITGFFGNGAEHDLRRMNATLVRRGPDSTGYFSDPRAKIFLGIRRLAIIDVAGGTQPITNEDGSIVVVLNGEIYNYQELRKRLEGKHTFKTHSDTETIVHLYEEEGDHFVEKLEGMFGIALWDARRNTLVIARDRFGEKPIYYAAAGGAFVFGSEMKAVLEHPSVTRDLDRSALSAYLRHEYVPAPATIFSGIKKLPPAHVMIVTPDGVKIRRYWDIETASTANPLSPGHTEEQLLVDLDAHLSRAVKSMLVADVPLGIFLSGGIDSSTIAWYAQRNAGRKVHTFSIGFEDASFDESGHANRAAELLGTDHASATFSGRDLLKLLPDLYAHIDEPFADPSLLPTTLLSHAARKRVTVALGGDGADELFWGYPTFQAEKLARWYRHIPAVLRNSIIRPLVSALPSSSQYLSFDYRLKRFVRHADESGAESRHTGWIGAFPPAEIPLLLADPSHSRLSLEFQTKSGMARPDLFYLSHYLPGDILVKADRASMFEGLETRAPFLDPALATFIYSLPVSYKLRGFKTKYLLKKLMRPRLGADITDRKKHGFQPPIARWLRQDLAPLVREHLNESSLKRDGIFNPVYVARLIAEHQKGTSDRRKELWTLLVFHLWKQHWYRQ